MHEPVYLVVVYEPPCRRAGNVRSMREFDPVILEDAAFDVEGFLIADAVRRFCLLDCPICERPLRRQMVSDHPADFRLNELKPVTSVTGATALYYLLEEVAIAPGRLVLSAGR